MTFTDHVNLLSCELSLCTHAASCTQDSCSVHANCVETIGNYTCQCHPGFFGSRCEKGERTVSQYIEPPMTSFCKGLNAIFCFAFSSAIACKPLLDPEQGYQNCSNPYGLNRFSSSCLFQCGLGFQLLGSPQLLCQASGHWSHPVPLCKGMASGYQLYWCPNKCYFRFHKK